ncbi:hypothetical protein ABPG77_008724 [Micractinium sp. CCAP 211/92]
MGSFTQLPDNLQRYILIAARTPNDGLFDSDSSLRLVCKKWKALVDNAPPGRPRMPPAAPGMQPHWSINIRPLYDGVSYCFGQFDGPADTLADQFSGRVLLCTLARREPALTEDSVAAIRSELGKWHFVGGLCWLGGPGLDRNCLQAATYALERGRQAGGTSPAASLLRQLDNMVRSLAAASEGCIVEPEKDSRYAGGFINVYDSYQHWFHPHVHGYGGVATNALGNTRWQRQLYVGRFSLLLVVRCCTAQGSSLVLRAPGGPPFALPLGHMDAYCMLWEGEGRVAVRGGRLEHGVTFPGCTVRAPFLSYMIRLDVLAHSPAAALHIVARAWDRWQRSEAVAA